jgi:hypothetical protein
MGAARPGVTNLFKKESLNLDKQNILDVPVVGEQQIRPKLKVKQDCDCFTILSKLNISVRFVLQLDNTLTRVGFSFHLRHTLSTCKQVVLGIFLQQEVSIITKLKTKTRQNLLKPFSRRNVGVEFCWNKLH